MELTIDREFSNLCPDLTPEEYKLLEQSILDDGCREPITTWANHDDTILDGHNRYKICRKHDVKFKVRALNLEREQAIAWILKNQLGRRNLDISQRSMLAAKMPTATRANLPERNVAEIADEFNVSERSVKSARKVVVDGAAALQKAVESGDIPVSTAATLAELPKAKQTAIVAKGPEAVKKAVKKYKDEFDPAKLDKKKTINGKPREFNDNLVDKLYGQLIRQLDDRTACCGSGGGNGAECKEFLSKSYTRFLAWSGRKR